jgi:apolipoprotein N-acyltransferase
VALVGTLLAAVALAARAGRIRAAGLALLAAVAVACAGLLVPLPVAGEGAPPSATIAVVQGNVPQVGLDFNARRRAVLENHVTETILLSQRVARGEVPAPEAVIWPENSSDVSPFLDPLAAQRIDAAATAINAPILVGAVVDAPGAGDQLWNVGLVWQPGSGPSDSYAKQHPVPFGEYLPGRSLLGGLVDRFQRIPRDFVGGNEPGVLQVGPARVGDVICFEIAYDDIVRNVVRSGGRVLVVQTNNATYGGTSQPAQQVAMSRLRAVEHGRGVLVAATSGISVVLAADGTVVDQLPESRPGTMVAQVPLRDTLSVADRLGVWPEAVLAAVGVIGCVVGGVVGWRRRGGQRIGSSS